MYYPPKSIIPIASQPEKQIQKDLPGGYLMESRWYSTQLHQ